MTRAKSDMIRSVKSELDLWVAELAEDPDAHLKLGQVMFARDLWTGAELLELYKAQVQPTRPVGRNTIGLALRQVFEPLGQRVSIGGKRERFYVVRNSKKWLGASVVQIKKHIEQQRSRESGGGKF